MMEKYLYTLGTIIILYATWFTGFIYTPVGFIICLTLCITLILLILS